MWLEADTTQGDRTTETHRTNPASKEKGQQYKLYKTENSPSNSTPTLIILPSVAVKRKMVI